MIQFINVSKHYATHEALSDITVQIPDGDFVFVIGPSGAGKTTLLRLITRDMVPTNGKIMVDELDVSKISKRKVHQLRRKVGMIFQDFKLLTDRTVYENVAIALEILGKKSPQIKKEVYDALSLVGLTEKAFKFPAQLSAGELQRTSIARAMVMGPRILLADEPTGNLDPENAWNILNILQEINKLGTTIIVTTHNVEVVNQMKKRTITIHEGKIFRDEQHGKYTTFKKK
jgi:cell division transport system ATP-binding protein